jgi:DNA-binding transcriptional MerR regulator
VEARTLRSWVSERLLAPPFKPGRGARYPSSNADRALAVRALKDLHGLSLSEIGRRFMMATEDQIREWALEAGPTTAPSGSARDYLRRIQARNVSEEPPQRAMDFFEKELPSSLSERPSLEPRFSKPSMLPYRKPRSDERQAELASIEQLILQLEKVLESPAPRRSRGAVWTRISVTPDLELSVRGDLEPRERVLFEQLADQLRAILTGRTKND